MVSRLLSNPSLNVSSDGASTLEGGSLFYVPNHSNCKCGLPSRELESRLTGLELMLMKVVHSWRIEKLFLRHSQVTV